jgi:hypothetical protein
MDQAEERVRTKAEAIALTLIKAGARIKEGYRYTKAVKTSLDEKMFTLAKLLLDESKSVIIIYSFTTSEAFTLSQADITHRN